MKTKLSKSEYTTIERVLIGYVNTIKDQEGIDVRARGRERPNVYNCITYCFGSWIKYHI